MEIGFIGTGTITSAVVEGLHRSGFGVGQIVLSPRGAQTSARLAAAYPGVVVARSNEDVLGRCQRIVLAVRPQVAEDILSALSFSENHEVISFIAALPLSRLQRLVAPCRQIFRAVPLPPVALCCGPTVFYPPSPFLAEFFDSLGTAVPARAEGQLDAFLAVTATMASQFALLETMAGWLEGRGVASASARAFTRHLFHGLATVANEGKADDFAKLREEFSTRGGLNEQLDKHLREAGTHRSLVEALDTVMARLESAR